MEMTDADAYLLNRAKKEERRVCDHQTSKNRSRGGRLNTRAAVTKAARLTLCARSSRAKC